MKRTTSIAYLGAVAFCASAAALAPLGVVDFDLSWNTCDSGGGVSTEGNIELAGTIGQFDAGVSMIGDDWTLTGGFWPAAGESGPACPADIDDDGVVAFGDLLILLAGWGACPGGPCPADVDGDGDVAFGDLLILLAAWGPCV